MCILRYLDTRILDSSILSNTCYNHIIIFDKAAAISYTDVAKLDAQFLENRTRYNDNLFSGDDNFFFFFLLL